MHFATNKPSPTYIVLLFGVLNICSSRFAPVYSQTTGVPPFIYLADPTIFKDKGSWYLYGTGGDKYNQGFAVYSSKDLETWTGPNGKVDGYALKKGSAFGTAQFWAPQVFKYKRKYHIAYAANERIGIAESISPLGPFTSTSSAPLPAETKQIDPFVFMDTDGKNYLYYVVVANGGNRIFVAELQQDLLSIKSETARLCIQADQPWENVRNDEWSVTEGPTVLKHKGRYYLVYSANDFRRIDYAVGYATSDSPLGPWKKYNANPIISRLITGQNGSGHGDVVNGKDGQLWYVFHTHNSNDVVAPRKTAILRIKFAKDSSSGIDKLVPDAKSFKFLRQSN